MSSMFKKKGGPAFKPKIPSARRPAVPASSHSHKPAPPSLAPEVANETEPQVSPREPSNPSSPKVSAAAVVESQPQDSHEPGRQPPTPPSTIPEPPKPDDPANTQEALEETIQQDIQHQFEGENVGIPNEQSSDPAAIHTTAEPTVAQPKPTSEQEQIQPPVAEEPESQPAVSQANTINNAPSPILQTPTPDGLEEPKEIEPSTIPSLAITNSNEPTTPSSTEVQNLTKPARKPRARKQTTQATQDEAGTEEGTRPKKRQRKTTEGAVPKQPRKRRTPTHSGTSTPKNRRARSVTPEDSETQLVDLQKLKMADLTKDLHIGKKFSRHDELRERERRARMKPKLSTDGECESSATPEPSGQGEKTASPAASSPAPSVPAPTAPSGPQFRIVDGQIVVDQSSLAVDRHARAAAAAGDMETVEENDFTRLITSNSFMSTSKLRGPNIWTDAETELFYRGLQMFGTDFQMISGMFPNKQRRNVKLKFNREERHCPRRVNAALIGEKTVKMNIDEYKAFTGSEFEPVENIEAEQRKIQEEYEAEEQRRADEQAEVMRKKREELFKDDEGGDAKKRKKKKKQTIVYGLNGEPIAQEG
ncbi:hypothetical protein F66182_7291 [Fusarium sp. NRRL 66182]|nr:hypothetical protein F66182_7291 [Fusarium sp. NRRL 66182]